MKQDKLINLLKKITQVVEKFIIVSLIFMMAVLLILATIELCYYLIDTIIASDGLLISLENLSDLFGIFLLVLIGIELIDTIKVYLKENVVHVEVVVLVGIIALARKIVILKVEEMSGEMLIGIGVLIIALSVSYYLIKKTNLLTYKLNKNILKDFEDENIDDELEK